MNQTRKSGILLHITSLPGKYGIGELGDEAYRFIDFLANSQQKLWQILPLGPPGSFNSPYAPYSAFAGNPLLISLDLLVEQNLLTGNDLTYIQHKEATNYVDFDFINKHKLPLLKKAHSNFCKGASSSEKKRYKNFCSNSAFWLNDFALFMALKEYYQGEPWVKWPKPIALYQTEAIEEYEQYLAEQIAYFKFIQYLFFNQWYQIKEYATKKEIEIIGDLPIFVAHDSSDVWANRHLFDLDKDGYPNNVAGVPPDYFSETGQLWGNPLYLWEKHQKEDYNWWSARIETLLEMVDIIRIDHFRGFEAYWATPYGEKTAKNGKWRKGPGKKFFKIIEKKVGELPVIAEDLGFITKEVEQLRDTLRFPGIRVLQFAFEGMQPNVHSPHNHIQNCVVYTGTHDNDTTLGWFQKLTEEAKNYTLDYLCSNGSDITWDLIKRAYLSVANTAVIPLQDLLALGTEARMNTPGTIKNNWQWKSTKDDFTPEIQNGLCHLSNLYERNNS